MVKTKQKMQAASSPQCVSGREEQVDSLESCRDRAISGSFESASWCCNSRCMRFTKAGYSSATKTASKPFVSSKYTPCIRACGSCSTVSIYLNQFYSAHTISTTEANAFQPYKDLNQLERLFPRHGEGQEVVQSLCMHRLLHELLLKGLRLH